MNFVYPSRVGVRRISGTLDVAAVPGDLGANGVGEGSLKECSEVVVC